MNTQIELREEGKNLAKHIEYGGVVAERYWSKRLQRDSYRVKLDGVGRELWLSQAEMESAVFALLDVWKITEHPNRPSLEHEATLTGFTAGTDDGGESA